MEITRHERHPDSASGSAEWAQVAEDQEQFAKLFEDCRPQLLRICRRILGEADAAQDAVSDTYVRAYQNAARFKPGNFPGWLSRIAKRICLDRIRERFPAVLLDEVVEAVSTEDERRIVDGMQIRAILATLPDRQRRCLKLFYIEGFSAKDVAAATGFTEKQVKTHLQNGRRKFKLEWKRLEDKGDA